MKYRKLHGYKYLTEEPYARNVSVPGFIEHPYIVLDCGYIKVVKNYAFDGPSGPTKDDKTNMNASLIHDCQYQLMRLGLVNRRYRKVIDMDFRRHCIEDGMGKFRAWYYYNAVRIFGAKTCLPEKKPRGEIIEI